MRLSSPRRRFVALAFTVVAAGLALWLATRPGSGADQRATTNIIVDGTTDTVTNIDPAGNADYGSGTVDSMIYQHLLDFPAGGKVPSPSLATRCTPNADQTAWTCTLKKGVAFSNGDPMTSTDVKWSFDRVNRIHDPSGVWALISNLKNVTTNGDHSVTFHLRSPQATWSFTLTTRPASIVDRKLYPASKLVANTDVSSLVGTGPYRLTRFAPGQQAVFERNPNYSGAKAKNDQLIIKYYSKSSTMKLALQQGAIDMAFRDFTPTEYTALGRTKGIKLYRSSGALIRYIVLHQKRAPTDKPAVRQALAYLIPRQVLAARIYHDQVSPLYSTVPAGLPGHIDAFAARYGTAPNPTKAKAVLQRAGLTTPVPLTLWWTPSHYGDSSADEYAEIQRALNTSGLFKVTLKSAEWTTYAKTLGTQYGAFQLGWFPDYPDAEDYLAPLYSTASNFFSNGYSNPAMDATLKKEAAAKSTAQRLQYLSQAQTIAAKDVPIIPYAQAAMLVVARSNVHGVSGTLDATYNMRFWMLSKS